MNRFKTGVANPLVVLCLVTGTTVWLAVAGVFTTPAQAAAKMREVNVGGYLMVAHNRPAQPVVRVSWQHTMDFCEWL